jgi:hypothetical protein
MTTGDNDPRRNSEHLHGKYRTIRGEISRKICHSPVAQVDRAVDS